MKVMFVFYQFKFTLKQTRL